MKTVFPTSEIAHIWMHRGAPQGRCPGNAKFDGDAFYSYGTVIARHMTHAGKPWILHDPTTFSSSTGKTQSHLRRAFDPSVPVFEYAQGERGQRLDAIGPAQLFDHAVKQSADASAKAERARTNKDWHSRRAADWLEKAAAINTFFGLRRKVDGKVVDRLKAAALREEKKNAALRKKQELERAEREREANEKRRVEYELWKKGENASLYNNFSAFPVAFRIEETELVSSYGARVPLDAARVALRFILRKRGSDWRRNGETCPVGYYQLDSISDVGVVAGCHRIAWSEIDRVASMLEPVAAAA